MKVKLARPTLQDLDQNHSESMCVFIFQDVRPLKGLAGLVDWRIGAYISRLLQEGWYSGADGEKMLLPVKHKLPVTRLFCFGMGPRSTFTRERQGELVRMAFTVLRDAGVHGTIIAAPGRAEELAEDIASLETVCSILDPQWDFDEVIIVDSYRRIQEAQHKLDLYRKPLMG